MENRNQKNQNSIFLLIVGFVFIAVSGVLFATTAWKYLPMVGKQIILLVMTAGFFAGAYKANQNGKLKKTEAALYYLGTIFTGLLSASVFAELGKYGDAAQAHPVAWKLFFASLVMIVPACIRFIRRRKWFDYVSVVGFADAAIFFGVATFDGTLQTVSCCMAVMVIILSVGDYVREYWMAEDNLGLKTAFMVSYILHVSFYIWLVFLAIVCNAMEKGSGFLFAAVLLVSTLLIYKRKKNAVIRVCNSIAIMWCVIAGVDFINCLTGEYLQLSDVGFLFVTYVINVIISLILFRKELLYTQMAVGMAAPFLQIILAPQYYLRYQGELYADARYLPFTFVMIIASVPFFLKIHNKGTNTNAFMHWESKGRTIVKAVILQTAAAFITMSTLMGDYQYERMAEYMVLAIVSLTVALFQQKNSSEKCMLQTFGLLALEFAAFGQPFFAIPDVIWTEWTCLLLALGIVVLRVVWYDKKKIIEIVCFVLTCTLMLALLWNGIVDGELINVMILGIIGVIMLLAGACLNNRKYAVLATIVLLMLVVYITRTFWLSIAWWVYLFAAGVILVLLAIKKESES